MKLLLFPSDKEDAGSLPESTTASDTAADAIDASSTSDAAKQDENANQSLSDFVADELKKKDSVESDSSSEGEQKSEESDSKIEPDKKDKQEEKSPEGDTDEETEESTSEEEKDKGPIPYDRFKEVDTERNHLKQEVENSKPLVEGYKNISTFCQENGIDNERFLHVMKREALALSNPEEALKLFQAEVDRLQGLTGGKLPSDLQQMVDKEEMTPEAAQKVAKELAKYRFGSERTEKEKQELQKRQQAETYRQYHEAVETWETNTRKSDPDYKPKVSTNSPDGIWEKVQKEFLALANERDDKGGFVNAILTPKDAADLKAVAYKSVKEFVKQFNKKPIVRRPLNSNGSSTHQKLDPESASTMAEFIKAKGYG